jgi:hypothetical protein
MFSEKTADNLNKLAKLLIDNKGKSETVIDWPFKWGKIPEDIEFDRAQGDSLHITGEEYNQYHLCLVSLVNERELEYLSNREIDKELWHLVCEIFTNTTILKDPKALRKSLYSFQNRLKKPLIEYEIIIPIENLKIGEHVYEIAGTKLFEMSPEFAQQWGIIKDKIIHDIFFKEAVGKAVATLTENAADPDKAAERARDRVKTSLDILRVALLLDHEPRVISWKIHDEEMLFTQSEHIAIRKGKDTTNIFFDIKRGFRSVEFKVDQIIYNQLETSRMVIESLFNRNIITGHIKDRLSRTIKWISNSVIKDELDDKVIDICTALETLLTTKDDLRKGECIALRTTLLNAKLKKTFFNPVYVMDIYLKRSEIIHGSAIKVCTESDYQIGRIIALDILVKSLSYIQLNGIKQHKTFIDSLQDDKDLLDKAVDLWENTIYREDIKKAVERIRENYSK